MTNPPVKPLDEALEDIDAYLEGQLSKTDEWTIGDAGTPFIGSLKALRSEFAALVQERDTLKEHAEVDRRMHRNCCRERAALDIEVQRLRGLVLTGGESDYGLGVLQSHHKGLVELRMAIPAVLKSLLTKLRTND